MLFFSSPEFMNWSFWDTEVSLQHDPLNCCTGTCTVDTVCTYKPRRDVFTEVFLAPFCPPPCVRLAAVGVKPLHPSDWVLCCCCCCLQNDASLPPSAHSALSGSSSARPGEGKKQGIPKRSGRWQGKGTIIISHRGWFTKETEKGFGLKW